MRITEKMESKKKKGHVLTRGQLQRFTLAGKFEIDSVVDDMNIKLFLPTISSCEF